MTPSIPDAAPRARVMPTRCKCHPETCCCGEYTLMLDDAVACRGYMDDMKRIADAINTSALPHLAAAEAVAWQEAVAEKISSYGLSIEAARIFAASELDEYRAGLCDCADNDPTDMADLMMEVACSAVEKWKIESARRPFGYKPPNATTPAAQAPEGMVLVPREPTTDMVRAGAGEVSFLTHEGARAAYAAMLAAAAQGDGRG